MTMARLRRPERPAASEGPPPHLVRFHAPDWEDTRRPVREPAPPDAEVEQVVHIGRLTAARRRFNDARAEWAAENGIRRWGWTPGVTYEEWAKAGKP